MSEKTLPPTASRIRQARMDGQVGISQDLLRIVKLLVMAELAFATEAHWRRLLSDLLDAALRQAMHPHEIRLGAVWESVVPVLLLIAVLAVLPAVLAALTTLAQTNFNIAGGALGKGVEKFNIGSNLKNLVAPQKLMMAVLGPLKGGAMLAVFYLELRDRLPDVAQMYRIDPGQGWAMTMTMLRSLEHRCIVVLIILAVTDVLLQRYLVWRQMRMDISEVRRDHKQNEGDPMLKGERKREGRELVLAEHGPAQQRPSAVVVNPEHLAVSLYFEAGVTEVPVVLRMSSDEEARAVRRQARLDGIPIIRYVPLARHLYANAKPGQPVPESSYRAVALLLRVMDEYRQRAPDILTPVFREKDQEAHFDIAEVDDALGRTMFTA